MAGDVREDVLAVAARRRHRLDRQQWQRSYLLDEARAAVDRATAGLREGWMTEGSAVVFAELIRAVAVLLDAIDPFTKEEESMSQQFDYAVWRLQEHADRAPMEKLLRQLEERTVIGKQIAECRELLGAAAGKAPEAKEA